MGISKNSNIIYIHGIFVINSPVFYLEPNEGGKPNHRLVDTFIGEDITITNGRRETLKQKEPLETLRTVAFVGDSVVFGSGLPDNLVLANIIAKQMPSIQVLNFGVPGHNLNDYEHTLKSLKPNSIDLVILQITPNDITIAVAGFLGLLYEHDHTITHYDEFSDDLIDKMKLLFQKHWKSAYVFGVLVKRYSRNARSENERDKAYKEFSGKKCIDEISKEYNENSKKLNDFLDLAYRNETKRTLFVTKLLTIVDHIENHLKAEVIIIPNFGFHTFDSKNNSGFAGLFNSVEVRHLNNKFFDPNYHSTWQECGYFADNGHPGELYNKTLAVDLVPMIESFISVDE